MTGMFMSRITRSGRSLRIFSSASWPSRASTMVYPCAVSVARITRRICGSSSTTRMVAAFMRHRGSAAIERQREGEHRAVPELAGHADGAAVSFHDGLGDRQAHARALHQITLVLAAIKLVEDQTQFHLLDSRPAIGHADRQ